MTAPHSASWLFVPGSRPDRFDKAAASGADQVILDLEDAVDAAHKDDARRHVAAWLTDGGAGWVRVNASGTAWHDADVAAVADRPGLRGIMVPKAESAPAVARVASALPPGAGIAALVETATGILNAPAIAAAPAVDALVFGSVDFLLDIDAEDSDEALAYARGALVVAARSGGLPGPVDGITVDTRAADVITRDARRARRQGFAGKLCIHPAQVAAVNAAFAPSQLDVAWAAQVIGSAPRDPEGNLVETAFRLDDRMIDKPLLERARRILARADGFPRPD